MSRVINYTYHIWTYQFRLVLVLLSLERLGCGVEGAAATCTNQCAAGFFQCHYSCLCISQEKVCNGVYGDCGYRDTSDERNDQCRNRGLIQCVSPSAKYLDILPCSLYQVETSRDFSCGVTNAWWCDGVPQCRGGEDESDSFCGCPAGFILDNDKCKPVSPCTHEEFACTGGSRQQCIDPIFLCDGVNHCLDNASDEDPLLCYPKTRKCKDGFTKCYDSSGCYMDDQLCDNVIDCLDGTDELCGTNEPAEELAADGLFQCDLVWKQPPDSPSNWTPVAAPYWIPSSFRCDGVTHCLGSGEDEANCPSSNPSAVTNKCVRGSCHHKCTSVFARAGKSGGGGGGFKCSCYDGYTLDSDGYTCIWSQVATLASAPQLYMILAKGELMWSVIDEASGTLTQITMLNIDLDPNSFIASSADQQILIFKVPSSNSGSATKVVSYNIEASRIHEELSLSGDKVEALLYDSHNDLLFWSERISPWSSALKVSHKNGMEEQNYTLTTTIDSRIMSLAIHYATSHIYFTRTYSNGSGLIECISTDGSDRRVFIGSTNGVVSAGLNWPTNLRIDMPTNMLYFLTNNGRYLKQASLEAQPAFAYTMKEFPAGVGTRNLQKFVGFDIYNNQMFYAELERAAVYIMQPVSNFQPNRILKQKQWLANKIIKKLPKGRDAVSVWVVDASKHISAVNTQGPSCKEIAGCNDGELCLPRQQYSGTCVCPDNTIRDAVYKTCKKVIEPFVVYYSSETRRVETSDFSGGSKLILATGVQASVIHHDDSYVYWVDNIGKRITRAEASVLTNVEDVLLDLDDPIGLAVDPGSGTIFWSERMRKTIQVADKDGAFPSVLISRPRSPRYLALDLLGGYILWTEEKSKSIWRADMDGSNVEEIAQVLDRDCLPEEINFESVNSKVFFSCVDKSHDVSLDETVLYSFVVSSTGGAAHPPTEMLDPNMGDWCFSLFQRSIVIGKHHVRSYTNYNGELDDVIDFSQQSVKRLDVFKQHNSQVSDPCLHSSCEQRCLRTSTTPYFACSCYFGYIVDTNNHKKCVEKKTNNLILMSHNTGMKMAFLNEQPFLTGNVPLPRKRIGEFDFDPANNRLCYLQSDVSSLQPIRCVHVLTGELFAEYAIGEDVVSFALDTVGNKIYYSEARCKCIKVVEMYSSKQLAATGYTNVKTLVSSRIGSDTYGLLLDHDDGVMFWSHTYGNERLLERIDMNGDEKTRQILKSRSQNNIGDFEYPALDAVNNQIYYTLNGRIQTTGYTSDTIEREVADAPDYIVGITVLDNELYFGVDEDWRTDIMQYTITPYRTYNANELNSQPPAAPATASVYSHVMSDQPFSVNHIHAYSYTTPIPSTPQAAHNYCSMMNGHCDFMCLRNSQTFSCACPDGVNFSPGSHSSCEQYPAQFLQLPTQRIFLPSNITDRNFTFDNVKDARAVDFMYKSSTVYIGTRDNGIFTCDFNANNVKRVTKPIRSLEDIAVDWLAQTLYWLESDKLTVANLDGSFSKAIQFDKNPYSRKLKQAHDIVLHPFLSYVFISDWETPARIVRVHMDGSDFREIVPAKVTRPEGLTIDFKLDRLLFLDSASQIIQSRNLDGSDMTMMMERPDNRPGLQSMAINGSTLFFSEVSQTSYYKYYSIYACEMTSSGYSVHPATCNAMLSAQSENMGYETSSIAMVSPQRQPDVSPHYGNSPCSGNVAECPYLCLSSPLTITCACPDADANNNYETCTERSINLTPSSRIHPQYGGGSNDGESVGDSGSRPAPDILVTDKHRAHTAGNTFQDFELKLVMIVLVIIAIVVIILMVAILLLIRRHMIAAPPPGPTAHALYTNHDNIQAATLLFSTSNQPHNQGRFSQHGSLQSTRGGASPGQPSRLLNNQLRCNQNYYVEMPPHAPRSLTPSSSVGGHLVAAGGVSGGGVYNGSVIQRANIWTPTPEKNTNVQNMGTMSFSQPHPHMHHAGQPIPPPGSGGLSMFSRPFVSPPPPYQPPTNTNSMEDLQQHSTDDSSSA